LLGENSHRIVLDTDRSQFGGHDRVDPKSEYWTTKFGWNGRDYFIQVKNDIVILMIYKNI